MVRILCPYKKLKSKIVCEYNLFITFPHFIVQRTEKSRKSRLAEVSMKDQLVDAQDTISSEKTSKKEISTGE